MRGRALTSLGVGLLLTLVVAALLVPLEAWDRAVVPVLVTAVLGGLVLLVVARRAPGPPPGDGPDPGGRP